MDNLFDLNDTKDLGDKPIDHLRYHKTLGLAVCGDVRLTRLETEIIDCPDFQRLRRIQQLGPSSWVYPTALHTRFDHSLGVLKMTDTMITAIREGLNQVDPKNGRSPQRCNITDQQRILARLCGLLHDVTHVPFGHTLEDELRIFDSHDDLNPDVHSEGLARFEQLMGPSSRIGMLIIKHLGNEMYDRLIAIIYRGKNDRLPANDFDGPTYDEFVYYLVSDTVCSDLIDYLERDSYFCNLGLSMNKRFLDYLYVADVKLKDYAEERRRVVVRLWKPRDEAPRRDIMTDLAGLLESRYKLAERVYFHHTKIIVGTMIGRSALEAKRIGVLNSVDMLKFGDHTLLDYLGDLKNRISADIVKKNSLEIDTASRLSKAVLDRDIYDQLIRYSKEDFDSGRGNENSYSELITTFSTAERRRAIENMLAEAASARPGDVLIYVASPEMNRKIARAVVDYRGTQRILKEVDDPTLRARLENIEDSHRRLWNADILVHPELTEKQRQCIRLAFEGHFMPKRKAEDAFCSLINATVANDEAFSNRPRLDLIEAASNAAKRLVAREAVAGHDVGGLLPLLRETLRNELDSAVEK